MKSEERHKLKTNELAETISHLPLFFEKHGKNILLGAIIAVSVVVGVGWWLRAQATERELLQMRMTDVAIGSETNQQMAVMRGMDPKSGSSYNPGAVVQSLADLSAQTSSSPIGMNALLKQAEVQRSELLFSDQPMTAEQREGVLQKIETLYQRVLKEYPKNVMGQGAAQIGLGLVAEDRGDMAKAREIYQQMIKEGATRYAGTPYVRLAEKRLKMLDEIADPVEFVAAPPAPIELPGEKAGQPSDAGQSSQAVPTVPEAPAGVTVPAEPAKPAASEAK